MKLALAEALARFVRSSIAQKDAARRSEERQPCARAQAIRQTLAYREALAGESNSRLDEFGPRPGAVFLPRKVEASDRTRYSNRAISDDTVVGGFAVVTEEHVSGRGGRRSLPKIDEGGVAIRETDQHETAASNVAGYRMRNSQDEAHSNRRVDGIAALSQNSKAGHGGVVLRRNDHRVSSPGGFAAGSRASDEKQACDETQTACYCGKSGPASGKSSNVRSESAVGGHSRSVSRLTYSQESFPARPPTGG